MLQLTNGSIVEMPLGEVTTSNNCSFTTGGFVPTTTTVPFPDYTYYACNTIWNSYPVYVCSDKTKKAIEILKALQAEKQIECKSVPKFIELVEKISNLL